MKKTQKVVVVPSLSQKIALWMAFIFVTTPFWAVVIFILLIVFFS